MKKSEEEKEKSSLNSERDKFYQVLAEAEKELKAGGARYKIKPIEDGFTVLFNPPKSLVEKIRKAKQEEAAKKKK